MKKLLLLTSSTILIISFISNVGAVNLNNERDKTYSKASCTKDILKISKLIKNNHPAAFELISEARFDSLVNAQIGQLQEQNTLREFHWIARKIVASIGCLHTSLYGNNIERQSPIEDHFSLDVRYVGDELYIINDTDDYPTLTSGERITHINGISAAELKSNIGSYISADYHNPSSIDHSINRESEFFIRSYFGIPEQYQIRVADNETEVNVESGVFLPPPTPLHPTDINNLTTEIYDSEPWAKINIRSFNFYNNSLNEYKSFVDQAMEKINAAGTPNLIIDIRDNGGGDPYASLHLLQYIATQPFHYFDKSSEIPNYMHDLYQPHKERYKGKVYVITNGGCGSSSGHFLSLIKHYQMATIVGEQSGATYRCHDNSRDHELTYTKLNLHVPTMTFATVGKTDNALSSVEPDIKIIKSLNDWMYETDCQMEAIVELIE